AGPAVAKASFLPVVGTSSVGKPSGVTTLFALSGSDVAAMDDASEEVLFVVPVPASGAAEPSRVVPVTQPAAATQNDEAFFAPACDAIFSEPVVSDSSTFDGFRLAETVHAWTDDAPPAFEGNHARMAQLALAGSVALVSSNFWEDETANRKAERRQSVR